MAVYLKAEITVKIKIQDPYDSATIEEAKDALEVVCPVMKY